MWDCSTCGRGRAARPLCSALLEARPLLGGLDHNHPVVPLFGLGGERCVAGLIPRGGANIEVGARTDSARFETPKDWWIPLMER